MSGEYVYTDDDGNHHYVEYEVSGSYQEKIRNPHRDAQPRCTPDVELADADDLPDHVDRDAVATEIYEMVMERVRDHSAGRGRK